MHGTRAAAARYVPQSKTPWTLWTLPIAPRHVACVRPRGISRTSFLWLRNNLRVPRPALTRPVPSSTRVPGSVTTNPAAVALTGAVSTTMQRRVTDRIGSVFVMTRLLSIPTLLIRLDIHSECQTILQGKSPLFSDTSLECVIQEPAILYVHLRASFTVTETTLFPDLCKFPVM